MEEVTPFFFHVLDGGGGAVPKTSPMFATVGVVTKSSITARHLEVPTVI